MIKSARQTAYMLPLLLTSVMGAAWGQGPLVSVPVRSSVDASFTPFDGWVEAVRQTDVAAQVSGTVISMNVKVGDSVKSGQLLLRIDAKAAEQVRAASQAQAQVAQAALNNARQDLGRQQQLFQQHYISQAALDRAQAQFQSTQAQVAAGLAQANTSQTQVGFFNVTAPYAGVVSEVSVTLGDMAMPGKTLVTVYDPSAMRITAAIPSTITAQGIQASTVKIDIPGQGTQAKGIQPTQIQILPSVAPGTHTRQVRLDLAATPHALSPGEFARVWLPTQSSINAHLSVPTQAVVKRGELIGVYVISPDGTPRLRQVRIGQTGPQGTEILTGVSAGERVALDPQAAARIR